MLRRKSPPTVHSSVASPVRLLSDKLIVSDKTTNIVNSMNEIYMNADERKKCMLEWDAYQGPINSAFI